MYPEERQNTYFVLDQGRSITDYFSVDFTLDELKVGYNFIHDKLLYYNCTFSNVFDIFHIKKYIFTYC